MDKDPQESRQLSEEQRAQKILEVLNIAYSDIFQSQMVNHKNSSSALYAVCCEWLKVRNYAINFEKERNFYLER